MVKVITNHKGVIQGLSVAPSMFNIMFHTFIWDWIRQTHMHQAIKTGDFSLYPDDFVKRNPNPPPCRRRNRLTPTSHRTPWSRSRPITRRRGGPPSRYAMSSGRVWKEGSCWLHLQAFVLSIRIQVRHILLQLQTKEKENTVTQSGLNTLQLEARCLNQAEPFN